MGFSLVVARHAGAHNNTGRVPPLCDELAAVGVCAGCGLDGHAGGAGSDVFGCGVAKDGHGVCPAGKSYSPYVVGASSGLSSGLGRAHVGSRKA